MSDKFSRLMLWLTFHRSQIQLLIITVIFALVLLSVLAPQMRMLAEDAGGLTNL